VWLGIVIYLNIFSITLFPDAAIPGIPFDIILLYLFHEYYFDIV